MYEADNLPRQKGAANANIDEALFNLDTTTMEEAIDTLLTALVDDTGRQLDFGKMGIAICSASARFNAGYGYALSKNEHEINPHFGDTKKAMGAASVFSDAEEIPLQEKFVLETCTDQTYDREVIIARMRPVRGQGECQGYHREICASWKSLEKNIEKAKVSGANKGKITVNYMRQEALLTWEAPILNPVGVSRVSAEHTLE
ncbi:hypothetical protein C8R47DRAFT_1066214 [Mycena vitilis]|nr:hypothetical protein C8R47DRAFT_1066214 [Mycena vitilis]